MTAGKADIEAIRDQPQMQARFIEEAVAAYDAKEEAVTPPVMRELERVVLLNITDTKWREHLYEMDYLQEGIHLRAYAQRDPLTEYQREAFDMFHELTESIRERLRPLHLPGGVRAAGHPRSSAQQAKPQRVSDNRADVESTGASRAAGGNPQQVISDKVRSQRPLPLRVGQEVQEVPRRHDLTSLAG